MPKLNWLFKAEEYIPHSLLETRTTMLDVLIALIPAWMVSVWLFGYQAFAVQMVCVAAALGAEYLCRQVIKKPQTVSDLSCVVTGLLLSFSLPASMPLWQAALGSVMAIVVAKQLFGGFGRNFLNPALFGRIALLSLFPDTMSRWPTPLSWMGKVDAVSGATPLATLASDPTVEFDILQMLLGVRGGGLGETCVLALVLGGIYLVLRRVIHPVVPLVYIGSVFMLSWICGTNPIAHILCGGLVLGAIFMATDPIVCPKSIFGKVIYALGCGALTVLMRQFGSVSGGVSLAIIGMNVLTPWINQLAGLLSKLTRAQDEEGSDTVLAGAAEK